jgi:nucleotide-binding universal stress UspA family protein
MKFLVAYSGTQEAEAALAVARTHAKIFKAQMVVVSSSEGGKGEKLEDINKIKVELERIQKELSNAGIECQVEQLARGLTPGEDIVLFADENDIDQIFVGIRKKSRTSKLILGSTAQFIILKANCPVTSVK